MTPERSASLPVKLGVKPGYTVCVVNAPAGYMETLGALVTQARIVNGLERDADIIQVFVTAKGDLEASFPHLVRILGKPHALWVCWPKGNAGVDTDLKEAIVRDIGLKNGLVDVKSCAVDDVWSGLKFVYRLKDR